MIINLIKEAGPWAWWILGIVLLVAEIAVPGNILVWVGVAGLATGLLSNIFWETSWWGLGSAVAGLCCDIRNQPLARP
jgi:inner membrane protein